MFFGHDTAFDVIYLHQFITKPFEDPPDLGTIRDHHRLERGLLGSKSKLSWLFVFQDPAVAVKQSKEVGIEDARVDPEDHPPHALCHLVNAGSANRSFPPLNINVEHVPERFPKLDFPQFHRTGGQVIAQKTST